MSLQELLDRELAIAKQADPNHCSECGRYLDRWYLGFPLPLCVFCSDARKWGVCPRCSWVVRQTFDGSGVLIPHGPKDNPCPGTVALEQAQREGQGQ